MLVWDGNLRKLGPLGVALPYGFVLSDRPVRAVAPECWPWSPPHAQDRAGQKRLQWSSTVNRRLKARVLNTTHPVVRDGDEHHSIVEIGRSVAVRHGNSEPEAVFRPGIGIVVGAGQPSWRNRYRCLDVLARGHAALRCGVVRLLYAGATGDSSGPDRGATLRMRHGPSAHKRSLALEHLIFWRNLPRRLDGVLRIRLVVPNARR